MAELKKILKNRNNRLMLVILIIGIAIIVISGGIPGSDTKTANPVKEYEGEEERLSEILSQIDGAGRVWVMISYKSTMEKDIAYDGTNERAVLSDGDVVIRRELFPEVKGVIVIAEGAGDPAVRNAIREATAAVTGAGINRVCVYSGGG